MHETCGGGHAGSVRTSEWVYGDEHSTDVSVDFAILPPLLEVLVNALICDRGQESHVGYTDLLLLETLLPVRLHNRHK